jgi:large conductance mechanosensitive channel
MPLIGILIGGIDFSGIVLTVGAATVNIGLFINAVVKFTIVAFVLFMVVKAINSMKREAAQEPVETTPAPSKEEVLLTEIRDALRAGSKA